MAPIIRTEKLRKVYAVGKERVVALNNVDLSIEKGEFCCIVGQSGSGKSTLLNQLAGLEKPTSGKGIHRKARDQQNDRENELAEFRQQHLGFIFQSYNLLPTMTAAENVALPLMFKGVDKKTRLARARKELKSMGLLGRANHLPTEMSGGQQQRVGIARAFVSSPKVIFADEPTGNLDSRTSKQVLYRMLEMSKNSGVTFVMVTHEPDLAECADRIVTILDGKVCSNVVQDEETKKKKTATPFCRSGRESGYWRGGSEGTEKSNKPSPLGEGARGPDRGRLRGVVPPRPAHGAATRLSPSSAACGRQLPPLGKPWGYKIWRYKPTMKRLFSLLTAFVLAAALCAPVMADDVTTPDVTAPPPRRRRPLTRPAPDGVYVSVYFRHRHCGRRGHHRAGR